MKYKSILILLLSIILVVLYPILFMFFLNFGHASLGEFLEITGIFLVYASLIYLVAFIITREKDKAGLLTIIVLLFTLFFKFFEKAIIFVFPMLFYWHVLMLVLTLIYIIALVIKNKTTTEIAYNINKSFLLIFTSLIIFNLAISFPKIINGFNKSPQKSVNINQSTNTNFDSNIYYLIFDEFGGLENIEHYCNYNNSLFYDSLEDLGFNVSPKSHNLTIHSDIEIPNLLNLELINNIDTPHETRIKSLKDPYLFGLLKKSGYKLNILIDVVNHNHIPIEISEVDYEYKSENKVSDEVTVKSLIVNNSVFYPILIPSSNIRIEEINKMFSYIKKSSKLQPNYLFTFGYFSTPHLPWVVDEYGRSINPIDRENWENSKGYCGQFKFTSKKIIEIMKSLVETDPDSIIIIQSDHGFRKSSKTNNNGSKYLDSEKEDFLQRNILNAVYYKGEVFEIESLSGINTLIKVFNSLFELNYPYIEQVN